MSHTTLKMSLSAIALLTATSVGFAQTATGTTAGTASTGSMHAMPNGANAERGSASPMAGSDLSNSTNSLERGNASGKGSGPGAGSPNGN